ncbi:methionyl-tRNA formyltransferase [Dongia sp. agr-C8]
MTSLKVIFMGTPDFAAVALKTLIDAGHEIAAVYSQPPRPAGRGHDLRKSPVHLLAEAQGFPVRTPVSLKLPEAQAAFAAFGADVAVVAAYGLILPQAILDAPRRGCLNIHASLLPRWRGAAPIQRAILAGDAETGISIMQMDAGLDTGAVLLEKRIAIGATETAGELHDRLAALGGEAIVAALAGSFTPRPQPGEGVTYAAKISPEEARLDWNRPAAELARAVRAFNPVPGAWTTLPNGERLKILSALVAETTGTPGTLLDRELTIACGEGALRPLLVQRQGKRAMETGELLRGLALKPGERFA